jgi:uncharacterized protein (TIGR02231 family)
MEKRRVGPLLVGGLLPLLVGGALAAELDASAPIVEVIVFPDRAEVVRIAELEVPAGSHLVRIAGLPGGLIGESVRAEATASGALRLGAVETRPEFTAEAATPAERELLAVIRRLEWRLRELDDEAQAARVRLDFVTRIGKSLADRADDELVAGVPEPEVWQRTWSVLGDGAAAALGAIRAAEAARQAVEAELAARRQELARVRTGQRATVVAAVGIEAEAAQRLRLRLRYQVPGASWRPLYEARLDSGAARVTLVQRGEVRQSTGEAWTDVALTLSTARPGVEAEMPTLEPWSVDILEIRPLAQRPRESAARSLVEADEARAEAEAPAAPVMAELVASELAAEYRVAGPASVTADSAPKAFTLRERELPVRLEARATPKLVPAAFLYGSGELPGPEPLLPGPVLIFRDGAFTGRATLPVIRPGEAVALPFGVDDRIEVDYRLETGVRSTEGIFNKERRLERHYRVEVTNRHGTPIPITVIDQVPVAADERITVDILGDTTRPTTRDPDGRMGVLEWRYEYGPGESRLIRLGFAVQYPEGEQISGF